MRTIKDIATALALFEEAANAHADATEKGDYKVANKNYRIINNVINFLDNSNERELLKKFLTHTSESVKSWAATYLLTVYESESIMVLEKIAGGTGIHSLDAATTLNEWRKGNLKV